jgi:hypothetical protein
MRSETFRISKSVSYGVSKGFSRSLNFKDFLAILDQYVTGIIDNSLYRCNTVICSNLIQAILGPCSNFMSKN